ncbi:MAG: hypothetical protein QXZ09_08750, partial [Candidatus Methanomethylicaceae archaeon]
RLEEAMVRAEERLTRLEEAMARAEERLTRLEEAMVRAEERLTRLEEAMVRAEERLTRLEEAMARAEERLTRLEEAMVRAEERLTRLEEAVVRAEERLTRLEEAQIQMQAQLQALTVTVRRLTEHLQGLSNNVGAYAEARARAVFRSIFQEKGYEILQSLLNVEIDHESDLIMQVRDPHTQKEFLVLVEAKHRLRADDARNFRRKLTEPSDFIEGLRLEGYRGRLIPYLFGLTYFPNVRTAAQQAGIGLAAEDEGEILPPSLEVPLLD